MTQMELQKMLGERLERICMDDISDEVLVKEIERSRTVASLAKATIRSAELIINTSKKTGNLSSNVLKDVIGI